MKRLTTILLITLGTVILFFYPQWCSAEQLETSTISNSELRTEIRDIFKDPRFHQTDYLGLLKQFFQKIFSFLKYLHISKPTVNFQFGGIVKKIAFGIALLLPFLLIFWFSRFYSHNSMLNSKTGEKSKPEVPHYHLEIARKQAARGEYREAIRYLYLEALTHLKNENLLPDGLQYSDYDHLRALRQRIGGTHHLYLEFQTLLRLFQEKWYGLRSCNSEDYSKAYQLLNDIFQASGGYHETN